MPRAQLTTILLVFLVTAPVAAIALWSTIRTVIELTDPCATWNYPPGQPVHLHAGPHDACRAPSVHPESRLRAVTRAALVPGALLAAAILAMAGAVLSRRRFMIASGIAMLLETLVVFTIAPLTLLAGVSILILSHRGTSTPSQAV
jgi:hypothetical protein